MVHRLSAGLDIYNDGDASVSQVLAHAELDSSDEATNGVISIRAKKHSAEMSRISL